MRLHPVGPLLFLLVLLSPVVARAQVEVRVQLEKREILAGEPVAVLVTITNRAGRDLTLSDHGRTSWLDFVVKDGRDQPVALLGRPTFAPVMVGAGQSVARRMEISRLFRLSELGSYAITAVVRISDDPRNAFLSNRHTFNVTTGRSLWTQKIGMGSGNDVREYRLINFSSGQNASQLYVQIADARLGVPLKTFSLGEALLFREPQVAVDGQRNLHVLHLVSPTMWVSTTVSPDGAVLSREAFKRGEASDPRLATFGDGSVQIHGGIPYDPAAEETARSKVRNLSDRPD